MKKQLRKAMIGTVAMMVAAIVSLTGVTYAWFSQSTTSTVSGINVGIVQVDGSINISNKANPSSWGTKLILNVNKTDFEPASTAPSTLKNGKLNFFSGRMGEVDTNLLCTEPISSAMGADKYYVEQDLYIKNDTFSAMSIVLDQAVTSVGTSTAAYAMRLAIVDHGAYQVTGTDADAHNADSVKAATADKVYIYEFNATDHIVGGLNSGVKNTCGVKAATVTDPTSLPQGADGPIYEEPTKNDDGVYDDEDEKVYFDRSAHETAALAGDDKFLELINAYHYGGKNFTINVAAATEDATTKEIVPSYHKITVYLWLEGQDIDCVTAISGATLPISIGFTQAG